jgi:hypothetical protein
MASLAAESESTYTLAEGRRIYVGQCRRCGIGVENARTDILHPVGPRLSQQNLCHKDAVRVAIGAPGKGTIVIATPSEQPTSEPSNVSGCFWAEN